MTFAPLDSSNFASNVASAFDNRDMTCYAIIDKAQHRTLLKKFAEQSLSLQSRCLLPAAVDSEEENYAPHLVEMSPLAADREVWPDILAQGASQPANFTLLASWLSFDDLLAHLGAFTEILLPDDTEMIFAFWDPAVLGTLTGQASDTTLHVPIQTLTERQRARFLQGIAAWWYWDRDGNPQQILPRAGAEAAAAHLVKLPLKLAQVQVDILVEAGVPDLLLSMLRENQPGLLRAIPDLDHYKLVQKHLVEARHLKLLGMQDMLNYICAALIYGEEMQTNPQIVAILAKVKAGEISFDAAMKQFPG